MIVTVIAPDGPLCAAQPQFFDSSGGEDCQMVEWICIAKPEAVSDDDIEYTAVNSLQTYITVPIEGEYSFAVRCCVIS